MASVRRWGNRLVRAAGLLVVLSVAAATAAPAADGAPPLQPLAFLANACWEGPLPGFVASNDNPSRTLSHCLEWSLEGHILRDTLSIEGAEPPVRGETSYYWDAERQALRYIFWSVGGAHSVGSVKTQDGALVFDDERLIGNQGVVYFRTIWTPIDADSYRQNRQRKGEGGQWTNVAESVYVRRPLDK